MLRWWSYITWWSHTNEQSRVDSERQTLFKSSTVTAIVQKWEWIEETWLAGLNSRIGRSYPSYWICIPLVRTLQQYLVLNMFSTFSIICVSILHGWNSLVKENKGLVSTHNLLWVSMNTCEIFGLIEYPTKTAMENGQWPAVLNIILFLQLRESKIAW